VGTARRPLPTLRSLRNICAEQELDEVATAKDFLAVRQEGMRLSLNEQGLTALTLLIAEPPRDDQRTTRLQALGALIQQQSS